MTTFFSSFFYNFGLSDFFYTNLSRLYFSILVFEIDLFIDYFLPLLSFFFSYIFLSFTFPPYCYFDKNSFSYSEKLSV